MSEPEDYKYLHPYWRMPYIIKQVGKEHENPFEKMYETDDDRSMGILWRGKHNYFFLNKYPYTGGHILVLPYRVVPDISELNSDERPEFFEAVIKAKDLLQTAMQPAGFNIGINLGKVAGGSVRSHVHCHVVPRWQGDVNFIPATSDTKILPQSLEVLWDYLIEFMDEDAETQET